MAIGHPKGLKLSKEHKLHISEGIKKHLPRTAWKKGQHFSKETEFKKGQLSDEKHPNWKGDKVGYFALHNWIKRKLGIPNHCELCKRTEKRKYFWANKNGEYKRNLTDWFSLCMPCHVEYDNVLEKAWQTRRRNLC